jgi:hypothetical protein
MRARASRCLRADSTRTRSPSATPSRAASGSDSSTHTSGAAAATAFRRCMRSAAARIHWSARGTSVTSSHAQKNPQKIEFTVMRSFSSPEQAAARPSSNRTRPSSTRSVMTNRPPRNVSASNSMSGSPSRRPTATASRSRASGTCASGSVRALMNSTQPCSGPALAGLLEDGAGARQPAVADRPVAEDVAGDPGGGHRRPGGGGVAVTQGGRALVDHGGAHLPMMA